MAGHEKIHATDHTDGTDDIQDATNAVKGLATAAQITALEAIATAYGEIYVQGNSSGQTTNASADTFDKVTQFASDGVSDGCTNAAASDQITVGSTGIYNAHCEVSFSGTLSVEMSLRLSVNGTDQAKSEAVRKIGTNGDVGSASIHALLSLTANDIVTLEVASNGTSDSFVMQAANLSVVRVG